MLLKYFYDEHLAQASYLVGCVKTGEAMVVDPARAIAPYLEAAEKAGLQITHIAETHIHADFVSGSRELAAATGATIYLSAMGGAEWQYAYADDPNVTLVRDGDSWRVGNVRIEAVHTPGHTPEHLSFLVTDTVATTKVKTDGADEQYIGAFTGDFLFVGDVGRPDLLEEAVGVVGSAKVGAAQLFQSLRRFRELPDYLQIWPGHGAGSACGKSLGAVPSTTLGYEKLFNPAFRYVDKDGDEAQFTAWLLDGQPEAPRYFAQMKRVNKQGPALLADVPDVPRLNPSVLESVVKSALHGQNCVMDLRSADEYNRMFVPGTLNIPATEANFSTYVGWFVDYESPLYLILSAPEDAPGVIDALRAIGVDNIAGYFGPEAVRGAVESLPVESLEVVSVDEVAARLPQNGMTLLDVRGKSEYREQHITGAQHIPLGKLPMRLNELPHDETVVVHCAGGYRSQIAASLLRANGFENVLPLDADMETWSRLLPVERSAQE